MFTSKRKYFYFSFLCFILAIAYFLQPPENPLAGLNAEQLIQAFGYPLEIHQVETEDGYLLTLHRIPHGSNSKSHNAIPVLLTHGVFQTSADFIASGRGKALGLLLADRGFDVWLGNTRGNTWSRKHVRFDPDLDAEYWNFTLQEMSVFDVTANIDYILKITKQSNLHYIGYSQGTVQYVMALSERPEYNKKIRLMSALAPTILTEDVQSLLVRCLVFNVKALEKLFEYTGTVEIFPSNGFLTYLFKIVCNGNYLLAHYCLLHFQLMQGGTNQIDKDILPVFTSNTPTSVGAKQLIHIIQLTKKGYLQHYDYGNEMNVKIYGQEDPIKYEFDNLTAPISIYYSKDDNVINRKKIKELNQKLPNVVKNYVIPMENFLHIDFIMGKDAYKVLYYSVIDEMMKF